ncbi:MULTISPECIES: OmpW family outer membrane protein [unclassified Stenotrophomonas]|uniref:OmpW/AlkL family protein n=1 Tax=unclassified Stenotrophomonas TaxID=196198 RepID=UPI00177DCD84|nr:MULTISPECIES: OmpW family outer membrane protein [unclassified Stenotrophomonas]MBD8635460.1 outer membrane beta-barrel protein [Stenotrophomonas sp. CFBP 13725]MBD8695800.1 outer membrane beta-barrel protein [Stenotrophomonas sp. CFBP 13718]
MRKINILTLSLLTSAAFAPAAFAQDYTTTAAPADSSYTTGTDTASGKHFAVVGGVALLQPKNDPIDGIRKFDGGPAPTLSLSYYINDNWAVELWGAADKFNHRVRGVGNERLGTVEQQPIALSGQYHFGLADNVFRPFVGVGYYESNFSNEDLVAPGVTQHIGLETAKGAIGTVGVDMNINSTWFARADARYMHSRPEVKVGGQGTGADAKLDPWTVGFGIGARF